MPTELRWIASLSASSFHAAMAIHQGYTLFDSAIADALAERTDLLTKEISACGLPVQRTLDTLAALAMGIENNTELATVAVTKVRGHNETTDLLASQIAGRIADLEAEFKRAKPGIVDELTLRGKPLKAQWDARAQGLFIRLAQLTDPLLVADRADVALVHPVLGGHGAAHLAFNSVRIEAVLANPHERLPEAVRLAWLVAQLQCDLPIFGERVARDRLVRIAALAMIPPVLASAETVEWTQHDDPTTRLALTAWRLVDSEREVNRISGILTNWWQTYLGKPPHWSVALMALDRMLE